MTHRSIELPATAIRALHSEFCGYISHLPEPLRDAMLGRAGGLDFEHFVLALLARRYLAHVRLEADQAIIGLAVPVEGAPDWLLFDMPGAHGGVDAAWIVTSETLDMDRRLALMLGGVE